jgi:hypothetical protein
MRSVSDYLDRANEFDRLTEQATNDTLKRRYTDIAECYRLLAQDRVRLIMEGAIISNEDLHGSKAGCDANADTSV